MIKARVIECAADRLRLDAGELGELSVSARADIQPGTEGIMAIRPEQIQLTRHRPADRSTVYFNGVIHDRLYAGDVTTYIVRLPDGTLIESLLPNNVSGDTHAFAKQDQVYVSWDYHSSQFLSD